MGASDIFDTVSGTLGLPGAADSTLILARNKAGSPILHIEGRDVEESEYALKFDPGYLQWELIGQADEVQSTQQRQALFNALKEAEEPLTPKQLSEITGLRPHYVRKALPLLLQAGSIQKESRGKYIYIDGNNGNNDSIGNNGNITLVSPVSRTLFPQGATDGNNCITLNPSGLDAFVPVVPIVPTDTKEPTGTTEKTKFEKMIDLI
jgi:hypothetical protein